MARVLVVDDQKVPRMAVSSILREAGYDVAAASSGEEGLEMARERSPDVIILDVYMPGMDGFEVVERLKGDPVTAPTPVIFLTAEPPSDNLIVRGLDLGAFDFLDKGCSRAELLARVGVMTRIKRSNDELSAIARISDTLIQTLDPADLGRRFVGQVRDVFRADAAIFIFAGGGDDPPLCFADPLDADDPLLEALARGLQDHLEHADEPHAYLGVAEMPGAAGVFLRRHEFQRVLGARVEHKDAPPSLVAVLTQRMDGLGRTSDAQLLHLIGRQATIAFDNALLHDRTRTQAKQMAAQADELERAMTERSRFFASMSHELRTPINAVIGYNQLLEVGAFGDLTDEQKRAVERVGRSAEHLTDLINDILDISKIEAGKMEVDSVPTDIVDLVRDTVATVQIQAKEKGLAIHIDAPDQAVVDTDPARVRQILLNLLSNAVKFTERGTVEVKVGFRDHQLDVGVTDTGPGIAEEDFGRVFEEFEQVASTKRSAGTGLGLPISRRLARLLGGSLLLESEVGSGSTFTLRLPRERGGEGAE